MKKLYNPLSSYYFIRVILCATVAILALHPLQWLFNTWRDPSYDSQGGWIFLCVCGLLSWSLTSPQSTYRQQKKHFALILLFITGVIRLVSQLYAINVIGALALAVDVYALGVLAGIEHRKRAVSPGWLAIIFIFSLPLERVMQRTIGYGLQHISADGACFVLNTLFDNVVCQGVRILLSGHDVLVDLPCSGARSALLLLLLYALLMATCRPKILIGCMGALLTLFAAWVVNVIRITILAIGIAFPESIGGIDVMASPWHDIVGLLALFLGSIYVMMWGAYASKSRCVSTRIYGTTQCLNPQDLQIYHKRSALLWSIVFMLGALTIIGLPRKAVDVSQPLDPIELPKTIAGIMGVPVALSSQEIAYYTQYGGSASKMRYGENALMVVTSTSPLRHLHAPDACLQGLGFDVDYVGADFSLLPTAIYKATDPNQIEWQIAVSFISQEGDVTNNIAEVVWQWMHGGSTQWSAIERITPWNGDAHKGLQWQRAVLSALNIESFNSSTQKIQFIKGNQLWPINSK